MTTGHNDIDPADLAAKQQQLWSGVFWMEALCSGVTMRRVQVVCVCVACVSHEVRVFSYFLLSSGITQARGSWPPLHMHFTHSAEGLRAELLIRQTAVLSEKCRAPQNAAWQSSKHSLRLAFHTVCGNGPPDMWSCSWGGSWTAGGCLPGSSGSGRCLWQSSRPGWGRWSVGCRHHRHRWRWPRWGRRSSGWERCSAPQVSWRCPPTPPCWTSGHPPWRLLLCWQEKSAWVHALHVA